MTDTIETKSALNKTVKLKGDQSLSFKREFYQKGLGKSVEIVHRWGTGWQILVMSKEKWVSL